MRLLEVCNMRALAPKLVEFGAISVQLVAKIWDDGKSFALSVGDSAYITVLERFCTVIDASFKAGLRFQSAERQAHVQLPFALPTSHHFSSSLLPVNVAARARGTVPVQTCAREAALSENAQCALWSLFLAATSAGRADLMRFHDAPLWISEPPKREICYVFHSSGASHSISASSKARNMLRFP
jgi:hypothetical protein